jgi:hypothetical protein
MLGRTDLRGETIALLAEVIAADARFNLAVASQKRQDEPVDFLELASFYEPLLETCMAAMASFATERDENRFAVTLAHTRDALTDRRKLLED